MLAAIGLSVFFHKWQVLGFPLDEDQETPVWTIESAVSFDSGPGSIKVQLQVPTLTPGFRILDENSVSRGYGFGFDYGRGGREAQWAIRRARAGADPAGAAIQRGIRKRSGVRAQEWRSWRMAFLRRGRPGECSRWGGGEDGSAGVRHPAGWPRAGARALAC